MRDSERVKLLFGPYKTPLFEYGQVMDCAIRGSAIVCGQTTGRIPWPLGKRRGQAGGIFVIVTGDLERAILRESAVALMYWWGVSEYTVSKWRRELGVGFSNEGSRRLRHDHALEPAGMAAIQKAIARAKEPEVRAKSGRARRGRPLHPNTRRAQIQAITGKPLSEEHRRKIRDALLGLGPDAPWAEKAWKPEEDALLLELPEEEVVQKTGRTLNGVKCRKRRLLRLKKKV
jgi:hypothetical protein